MDKSESKYFNTAVKMDEAFLSLIEIKDFDYITVKEICQKAGVNRSTFYLHYENIGDLLEESIRYMHRRFFSYFQNDSGAMHSIRDRSDDELLLVKPNLLRPYFEFIKENRKLYRAAVDHPDIFRTDKTYMSLFCNIFDPILERFSVSPSMRHYYMHFYLSGIAGIVGQWLKNDCEDSAEQLIGVIINCIPRVNKS